MKPSVLPFVLICFPMLAGPPVDGGRGSTASSTAPPYREIHNAPATKDVQEVMDLINKYQASVGARMIDGVDSAYRQEAMGGGVRIKVRCTFKRAAGAANPLWEIIYWHSADDSQWKRMTARNLAFKVPPA